MWEWFGLWVPHVYRRARGGVVSLDWTSFAADGHEVVALSMSTGHGRSTPLMWRTVEASELKGKRNDHEDALLRRLWEVVGGRTRVTVLADRGFADCCLLEFLEELGFGYVIRLCGGYLVTSASEEKRKAADWAAPGADAARRGGDGRAPLAGGDGGVPEGPGHEGAPVP